MPNRCLLVKKLLALKRPPLWLLLLPNADGTISSQYYGEEPGQFEAIK